MFQHLFYSQEQIFINSSKTYQIYSFKLRSVLLCVGICGSLKEIDTKGSHIRRCDFFQSRCGHVINRFIIVGAGFEIFSAQASLSMMLSLLPVACLSICSSSFSSIMPACRPPGFPP